MRNKSGSKKKISVNQFWLLFFGVWGLILTGTLDFWIQSPGIKQWVQVRSRLKDKRHEIDKIEAQTGRLTITAEQLESNPAAQEREIRKVLGFLGEQELVFEF